MSRETKMKLIGASGVILVLAIALSCIGIAFGNSEEKADSRALTELRKLMQENSIEAYLIPSNDAHQSEYVGSSDARLGFITGFTGSVGFGIVTLEDAAIWIDSRYHLQAERQVDESHWTIMKMGNAGVQSKAEWLLAVLGNSSKIGFDPLLLSDTEIASLTTPMTQNGHGMSPIEQNLIDSVWQDKPETNITPLVPHLSIYSGRNASDKIKAVRQELKKNNVEAIFLATLDDIAWLFNLRADDIQHTPVFYSYALVSDDMVQLYLHKNRTNRVIETHFRSEGIEDTKIMDYLEVTKGLREFVNDTEGRIYVPTAMNYAISSAIPASRTVHKNLVSIMKSVKNDVEAKGMKRCHVSDGAAIVMYLDWLEQTVGGTETVTELSGAKILGEFRR